MRRTRVWWLLALLLVLAGCGPGNGDATEGPDGPPSSSQPEETSAAERGDLTIAAAIFPGSLEPTAEGFNLIVYGAAETLTRVEEDMSIEPWLAESVEWIENATWEISLREGVTFWDGEPVDSGHVKEAIERAWAEQPSTARFLPVETDIEVLDDRTLRLILPEPDSALPNNLATFQLIIYKEGEDGPVMTGPYRPVEFRADEHIRFEAYDDYWGGVPALDSFRVNRVVDGNARSLAVQSGDVDLIRHAPPEAINQVGGDVQSVSIQSHRTHFMLLNHQASPFDDPAVRRAVNLAPDRAELNEVATSGIGAPISTIIAPELGIPTPDQRAIDVQQARQVLEDAGWETGDNGVRVRGDERLEFELLSYPQRPELTRMAVSLQDQLGRIGFDIDVREVDDIGAPLEEGDFQASMYSVSMLPTGDIHYALNTIFLSDGIYNWGHYRNEKLDELLDRIQLTVDDPGRDDLIMDAQETIAEDDAAIFLLSAPRSIMYRSDRVAEPTLHPSDLYLIDAEQPAPPS